MAQSRDTLHISEYQHQSTAFEQAGASCTGAVLTSLFVTPLDVVKIRLQAQQKNVTKCFLYCNGLMDHICGCYPIDSKVKPWYHRPSHFNGTLDALVKITRNEGMSSLWSGLSPTLILSVPTTVVYFVSYEQLKVAILKKIDHKEGKTIPFWVPLVSGSSARTVSATVVSPLELIRTKMQSTKLSYLEITEALKILIRQDGILGLWKGLVPTLLRDVPFSGIYWSIYEFIKSFTNGIPTFQYSFMAGAISGGVAAVITLPFDVVKTHQQIELGEQIFGGDKKKRHSTMQMIREIYRQSGYKGLFTGMVPRVVKVVPACAIMISTFEYGKVFFKSLAHQQQLQQQYEDNEHQLLPVIHDSQTTSTKNDMVSSNIAIMTDLNVTPTTQQKNNVF